MSLKRSSPSGITFFAVAFLAVVEAAAAALRLSRRTPIAATMSSRDKVPAAAFCRHIDIWAMTSGVMRVPFLRLSANQGVPWEEHHLRRGVVSQVERLVGEVADEKIGQELLMRTERDAVLEFAIEEGRYLIVEGLGNHYVKVDGRVQGLWTGHWLLSGYGELFDGIILT
jgi:hypothetical protein